MCVNTKAVTLASKPHVTGSVCWDYVGEGDRAEGSCSQAVSLLPTDTCYLCKAL